MAEHLRICISSLPKSHRDDAEGTKQTPVLTVGFIVGEEHGAKGIISPPLFNNISALKIQLVNYKAFVKCRLRKNPLPLLVTLSCLHCTGIIWRFKDSSKEFFSIS